MVSDEKKKLQRLMVLITLASRKKMVLQFSQYIGMSVCISIPKKYGSIVLKICTPDREYPGYVFDFITQFSVYEFLYGFHVVQAKCQIYFQTTM